MLVLIEAVRAWWIVIPAAGRGLAWLDVAAMAAVLGLAAAIALAGIPSARTSSEGSPSMPEAERAHPRCAARAERYRAGIHLGCGGAMPGHAPRVRAAGAVALSHLLARPHASRCRCRSIRSRGCSPIPQQDMQRFYAQEMQILNGTGWVDKERGVVHIPIAQAMQEVARRGHCRMAGGAGAPP